MKKLLSFILISSILTEQTKIVAAPVVYRITDVPTELAKQIDQAFAEWSKISGTSLKTEKGETASISFGIIDNNIPSNPDLATRTLITTENNVSKTEIQINQASNLDMASVLLAETGDLLGVKLDLGFTVGEKRQLGAEEFQSLRTQFPLQGDCSGDGKVNIDDLMLLASNFGKRSQGTTKLQCDFNNDNKIDQADLDILKSNYSFAALITEPKPQPTPTQPTLPINPIQPPTSPTQPNTPITPTTPVQPPVNPTQPPTNPTTTPTTSPTPAEPSKTTTDPSPISPNENKN